MKKISLDTNTYSRLFRGDPMVRNIVNEASSINISVIILGELYSGFKKGTKEQKNLYLLKNFLAKPSININIIDEKTAQLYGALKFYLIAKGTPIPTNDIWIAAHAVQSNSTLVTYDKHFLKIPKVKVWLRLKNN